ncbi:unnamed protein product [Sphagnum jensenii]|uniref:Pyrrolo-quinoline quinone repeat domain-containing protein n=1 Tax=Sphagnum jensenii TaxID=128206 RepID=A0ABP1A0Z0_9BRYO
MSASLRMCMLRMLRLCVVALCLLDTTCIAQLANTPWPCTGHDLQRSNRSPFTGPLGSSSPLLWQTPFASDLYPDNVIVSSNGMIIALNTNMVVGINGSTGSVIWTFDAPNLLLTDQAIGADNTVYIGSGVNEGTLFALNGTTGVLKWNFSFPLNRIDQAIAIGPNGVLYVGSSNDAGTLFAINATNHTIIWSFLAVDPCDRPSLCYISGSMSGVAMGMNNDGVVYTNSDTTSFALNATNGAVIWKREYSYTPTVPMPPPAISGTGLATMVYVGCRGGSAGSGLLALNGTTGAIVWFVASGMCASGVAVGLDGTVFTTGYSNIYALDGSTGAIQWQWQITPQSTELFMEVQLEALLPLVVAEPVDIVPQKTPHSFPVERAPSILPPPRWTFPRASPALQALTIPKFLLYRKRHAWRV